MLRVRIYNKPRLRGATNMKIRHNYRRQEFLLPAWPTTQRRGTLFPFFL